MEGTTTLLQLWKEKEVNRMDKFDKAIEDLSELERAYDNLTRDGFEGRYDMYLDHISALRMGITALKQQQEREQGCEHCRGWDSRCGANYCPLCGKDLRKVVAE